MNSADPTIYIDARCLQDPLYQFRGVGYHVSSLLRHRARSAARRCRVAALLDPNLPPLPKEYRPLFDVAGPCLNYTFSRGGSIFLNASPMTHDPRFNLRFVHHPKLLTAAIVYDFIPFDWPGYLPNIDDRIDYIAKLARLKNSALFSPISRYSAKRLVELLGARAADICVTGASVRSSLFEFAAARAGRVQADSEQPYFLTVGGGDRRKNTEIAVHAVRDLNSRSTRQVALRVVGEYDPDYKADLERLAGDNHAWLEFWPGIDDATLAGLYSGSVATIATSFIEGFSLPVVEASVCGSPVIASTCAAHLELIEQPEALFASDKPAELIARLTRVLADGAFRQSLIDRQAPLADAYHEQAVGTRFWDFVMERFDRRFSVRTLAFTGGAKPKVAVLSPFPPDQSGVARFTELTLRAAARHFDIDLFTNAPRPLLLDCGVRDAGAITVHSFLKNRYNAILSVLGNSAFHTPIFELFERYGGPCILHDSRLTHIYFHRLGEEGFLKFASRVLGKTVGAEEVQIWLRDRQLPSLFVEPVIERAVPLIVHTRPYRELLRARYGICAELTTFPPNIQFARDELTDESRASVRRKLGIQDGTFVVSSFGQVIPSKGVFSCIVALDLLRYWGIPAEFHFIGDSFGMEPSLRQVASEFGVADYVRLTGNYVDSDRYRDFMIASDAAIQLRTYGLGQASAALADCIGAGLPTVATCSLADACDAPSYIARIPDNISPLLAAEQLAEVWERGVSRIVSEEERVQFCRQHSFEQYAKRLSEILNL